MNVGVDEARHAVLALRLYRSSGSKAWLYTHNDAIHNGEIALSPLAGEDIEVVHSVNDEVARNLSLGRVDAALQVNFLYGQHGLLYPLLMKK